jgi:IS30 family transposase
VYYIRLRNTLPRPFDIGIGLPKVHADALNTRLLTLVDRKTRKLYAVRSLTMESGEIREAFLRALAGAAVRTITLDNGSEFAEFRGIEQDTGAEVYFAEPHSPWQRGTNENTNGLLRF